MKTLKVDKEWVKKKLQEYPSLRDNNEKLYFLFLEEHGYDTTQSIKSFLKDMSYRRIPYLDSVGRVSRLIQEQHPSLRGLLYGKRKGKSLDVKSEVKSIKYGQ
jgi:hypothetical protein